MNIILPNNPSTNFIENNLDKLGIKTVTISFKTVGDLLHSSSRRDIKSRAGI